LCHSIDTLEGKLAGGAVAQGIGMADGSVFPGQGGQKTCTIIDSGLGDVLPVESIL